MSVSRETAVLSTPIYRLQEAMREMPQAELETYHHFADGMYARVFVMETGLLGVGRVHKREHFFVVTKGRIQIVSDTGKQIFEAGSVIVSGPGTKRAVLALEPSICMTVHRTRSKTLKNIERHVVEPEPNGMYDAANQLKMRAIK